jgi:putative FmdB family regulatory protein
MISSEARDIAGLGRSGQESALARGGARINFGAAMPTYDYACEACGHHWDVEQRMSEDPVRKCPKCGKMKARRQITGGNFILKGGGWYSDLYSSSSKSSKETSSDSGAAKEAPKADAKPETKSETKPEAKPESKPSKKKAASD